MSSDNKGSGGKIALGAVIAAAAGYVAGMLTAPKSGKETRADIKNKANEVYISAEKELKKLHTELNDRLQVAGEKVTELKEKGGKQFDDAVAQAKKAKDKAREKIGRAHV